MNANKLPIITRLPESNRYDFLDGMTFALNVKKMPAALGKAAESYVQITVKEYFVDAAGNLTLGLPCSFKAELQSEIMRLAAELNALRFPAALEPSLHPADSSENKQKDGIRWIIAQATRDEC